MLPRYFVGTGAEHLTMTANRKADPHSSEIGEYYCWSPEDPLTPNSVMYYVMRRGDKKAHPDWFELPHILDSNKVKQKLQAANHPAAAKALAHGLVTANDSMFDVVQKVHVQLGVFLP